MPELSAVSPARNLSARIFPDLSAQIGGKQIHVERQRVGGFRVHRQRAVGLDIFLVERGLDVLKQLAVIVRLAGLCRWPPPFRDISFAE